MRRCANNSTMVDSTAYRGVSLNQLFGALAINADYHYRSFGVPGLGLKRGLAKDLVISPYSTMMALTLDPRAAVNNLQHLQAEGAHGTGASMKHSTILLIACRLAKRRLIVRCYMAHHHGMSLLALTNLLQGDTVQRWFNAHPLARAADCFYRNVSQGDHALRTARR